MNNRRVFSKEFKVAAVNRTLARDKDTPGERVDAVATELNISPVLIYRWRQQLTAPTRKRHAAKARTGPKVQFVRPMQQVAAPTADVNEVQALRAENQRMKKALGVLLAV